MGSSCSVRSRVSEMVAVMPPISARFPAICFSWLRASRVSSLDVPPLKNTSIMVLSSVLNFSSRSSGRISLGTDRLAMLSYHSTSATPSTFVNSSRIFATSLSSMPFTTTME